MALSDADVREILRLIDDAGLDELRVETDGLSLHVVRRDAAAAEGRERGASESADSGGVTIDAPMLGVFYRAPRPGAPPFVDVGTQVEPETIVCIIEVMKMMNSVPAGVAGTIAEVRVDNADAVEYGQPLFRVDPA